MAARQGEFPPRHVHDRLCGHYRDDVVSGRDDSRVRGDEEPGWERDGDFLHLPVPRFPGVSLFTPRRVATQRN